MQNVNYGPLRVGIAGPVGAGKTSITEALCKALRDEYSIAVITNDIYTKEDGEYLMRAQALPLDRIRAVETGGCPHTAIREDPSLNLRALDGLRIAHPDLDIVFIESGGDNLTAMFSPELADVTIFVVDVAMGQDIPRKGGPGITKSDILVVNKTDLAPYVNVDLEEYIQTVEIARTDKPSAFISKNNPETLTTLISFIRDCLK